MAGNAAEVVITARDEALRRLAANAQETAKQIQALAAVAGDSSQGLTRAEVSAGRLAGTTGQMSEGMRQAVHSVRQLASPILAELSPAMGQAANVIGSMTTRLGSLSAGASLVLGVLGGLAVLVGTHVVNAFLEASKKKREFQEALDSTDVTRITAQLTLARKEMQATAADLERLAKLEGERESAPRTGRDPGRFLRAGLGAAELGGAQGALSEAEARASTAAAAKARAEVAATFDEDQARMRKAADALSVLARTRIQLEGQVAEAAAQLDATEATRRAGAAAAGLKQRSEALEAIRTLERATVEAADAEAVAAGKAWAARQQGLSAYAALSEQTFARQRDLLAEETAAAVRGIEERVAAQQRAAQESLAAIGKQAGALEGERFFGQDTPEGTALRSQHAALLAQAQQLQLKLTEIANAGAEERRKVEEQDVTRRRQLRLQEAQEALADLTRALAAEKAARDQARSDAQGLLGQAAAALSAQGITAATPDQLNAEKDRILKESQKILDSLRGGGGAVPLSATTPGQVTLSQALGNLDVLGRGARGNVAETAASPQGPFREGQTDIERQIERETIRSDGTLPTGGLFGNEQEGPAVQKARQRAEGATNALKDSLRDSVKEGIKDGLDVIIDTFDAEGAPKFVVMGGKAAKAFFEGFAKDKAGIGQAADALYTELGDILTGKAAQHGF